MMIGSDREMVCPITAYDRAGDGYVERAAEWIAHPHTFFRSFGPEARDFQRRHPSERLRTMTLVAPATELAQLRPVCLCLDSIAVAVDSWEQAFSITAARLIAANPRTFEALQRDGHLAWMECFSRGIPVTEKLSSNALCPTFESIDQLVEKVQWLFLMCGIRLNEVILQVDPYTDEEWQSRKASLDRRRADDKAFMAGRRAAQRAWAASHPGESVPAPRPRRRHFL